MKRPRINRLTPVCNFPYAMTWQEKVSTLQRPYFPIDEAELRFLENHPTQKEIFRRGKDLFTFGDADDGKALMPINPSSHHLFQELATA